MVSPDGAGALIAARFEAVREKVAAAAEKAGRAGGVELLLATKTQSPWAISAAVAAGARMIGENRVEEVTAKAAELAHLDVERHFIGHLQRNKASRLVGLVTCVESVDSLPLAMALSRRWSEASGSDAGSSRDDGGRGLEVFVQVNISGEVSKSGCDPSRALELAAAVADLPGLSLRGLMTIASPVDDAAVLAREYGAMRALRDELVASGEPGTAAAAELSMGMTHDFEVAIAEGATLVRVGQAVFGSR